MGSETGDRRASVALHAAGHGGDDSSVHRDDAELRRMAAFRIRETANRIATLAPRARSEDLRRQLNEIWEQLLQEERRLLGDHG